MSWSLLKWDFSRVEFQNIKILRFLTWTAVIVSFKLKKFSILLKFVFTISKRHQANFNRTFTLINVKSLQANSHPRHTLANFIFTACKGQFVYLLRMKGFLYCVVNERKLNWNKNRMKTKLNVHVFIGFSHRNRLSLVSAENMLNNTLCACVSFSACDWFYTNVNFYRFSGGMGESMAGCKAS